jgi:hypothetical protein
MTNGQLASLSWCQAPIWDQGLIFILSLIIFLVSYGFVDVERPLCHEHILLSQFLRFLNLEAQVPAWTG